MKLKKLFLFSSKNFYKQSLSFYFLMNSLRLAASIYLLSIKEALAYRVSMMFTIVSFPIIMFVMYFVWGAVFTASQTDLIAGFTLEQMVSYYVMSTLLFTIIWNPIINDLHRGVREGNFTKFVVKPLSYPFFALFQSLGGRTLAFFIEFVPVMLVIAFFLAPSYVLTTNFFLFLLSVAIAFIIFHLLSLLIGSLIFWLTNPNGISFAQKLISYVFAGGLLPLTFFPEAMQRVLLFVPFPYFNFVPATIFVGNTTFAGMEFSFMNLLLYGGLQVLILGLITFFVWRAALKEFQGVGA